MALYSLHKLCLDTGGQYIVIPKKAPIENYVERNGEEKLGLLIADDEEIIRKGISQLIESYDLGIHVTVTAKNGEEALELIKSANPAIMIVDINMPLMNGLDFIERVRVMQPDSRIIILTGYDLFDFAKRAVSYGVCDYLLKPVNRNELRKALVKARDAFLSRLSELKSLELVRDQSPANENPLSYIKTNYGNPYFSLADVAAAYNLSPSQISRIIKSETGLSFSDCITMLRIEQAKRLLLSDKGY